MITKIGMVGVGVLAGLAAVAPLASASESHGDHHGHGAGSTCSVAGGEAGAVSNGDVSGLVGAVTQAPIGGANAANITCSPFLNDNVRDNLNGNTANLSIAGTDLPFELPGA